MVQSFSTEGGQGKTIGTIVVLQTLVAQIIARHPDRERIFGAVTNLSNGIREAAEEAKARGETEAFQFTSDIAKGIDDSISEIHYIVQMSDKGEDELSLSTTHD